MTVQKYGQCTWRAFWIWWELCWWPGMEPTVFDGSETSSSVEQENNKVQREWMKHTKYPPPWGYISITENGRKHTSVSWIYYRGRAPLPPVKGNCSLSWSYRPGMSQSLTDIPERGSTEHTRVQILVVKQGFTLVNRKHRVERKKAKCCTSLREGVRTHTVCLLFTSSYATRAMYSPSISASRLTDDRQGRGPWRRRNLWHRGAEFGFFFLTFISYFLQFFSLTSPHTPLAKNCLNMFALSVYVTAMWLFSLQKLGSPKFYQRTDPLLYWHRLSCFVGHAVYKDDLH